MKQGTAHLAEDYCFIHKALRPVGTARRQIAAVPPSNLRPGLQKYSGGRCDDILKWKPPSLNSVDFKLKVKFEACSQLVEEAGLGLTISASSSQLHVRIYYLVHFSSLSK